MRQGDFERATACYQESLILRQETGEKEGIAAALEGLAAVAGVQGHPTSAVQLYGYAETLRGTLGASLPPTDRSYYEQTVAAARAQLDEVTFQRTWAEGRAMSREQALAVAKQVKGAKQVAPALSSPPGGAASPMAFPPRGNPFGLTSREIEVLRLVTQGLTYAQIAEQLIISPRTADAHLRSIYGKLGVTSRSAATRYAIEHKLV